MRGRFLCPNVLLASSSGSSVWLVHGVWAMHRIWKWSKYILLFSSLTFRFSLSSIYFHCVLYGRIMFSVLFLGSTQRLDLAVWP